MSDQTNYELVRVAGLIVAFALLYWRLKVSEKRIRDNHPKFKMK